jgi:hypothetical protein
MANQEQAVIVTLSSAAKFTYGILLPLAIFIAYQFALIGSDDGNGSWDGMYIFFGSLVLVPALLVANCWVIPVRWRQRRRVFAAGMALPCLIAVPEYLFMHGPLSVQASILKASKMEVLLFIALLYLPLLVAIIHAVYRRATRNRVAWQ